MAADETKPRAREGLLADDHSKRGKRYVSILDPSTKNVTLLDPWEHAVLILCDGTRDAVAIAKLLEKGVEGDPVDLKGVQRCFKYFEREKLIEVPEKKAAALPPAGPRTLAEIQLAYREWHKDPVRTGQILSGLLPPPVITPPSDIRSGLDPTVALPGEDDEDLKGSVAIGSMLVLAGASESLLHKPVPEFKPNKPAGREREPETLIGPLASEGPKIGGSLANPANAGAAIIDSDAFDDEDDIAALLASVDEDVRQVESREAAKHGKKRQPPPIVKAFSGEAIPPETREVRRAISKGELDSDPLLKRAHEAEMRAHEKLSDRNASKQIPLSEAALRPTMVGLPADETTKDSPPMLLVPPKRSASIGDEATARLIVVKERPPSLEVGSIIDDASQVEGPTEGMIQAMSPEDTSSDPMVETIPARARRKPPRPLRASVDQEEQRTVEVDASGAPSGSSDGALPARAREVFDLLRRAGLRARHHHSDSDVEKTDRSPQNRTTSERPKRRRDQSNARLFDQALHSLSAGELDVALTHFKRLKDKLPQSKRLTAFIGAIEAVKTGQDFLADSEDTSNNNRVLENFEAALEEAVAYGRCPACFSMVAKKFTRCFACGFALG